MNHTQARELIQAAADGLISEANRRALEGHLAGCAQCQAYSNNLIELESRLSSGLQARWQGVQPRRFSLEQARARSGRSARSNSPGLRRLYQLVAVPAFQFGALAVVAVIIALVIGSAANWPSTASITETPEGTSETSIAMAGTTDAQCKAVADIDARVYREHNAASEVIGALPHGQTTPVLTYYLEPETNTVWLEIAYNLSSGWVTNSDAILSGDCSNVPTEGLSSETPATAQATVTATTAATTSQAVIPATPVPTKAVCDLVAPFGLTIFASPNPGAPVVGTLASGAVVPISAWAHDGVSPAWFQITSGNLTGWILASWYFPAQGTPCQDLPLTPLATPVASATPSATPQACVVAPSDYPAADKSVYTGPAKTYPILGFVPTGVYITATGIFNQENYDTWVRVDFNGQEGWMNGSYLMFGGGGCWPLPPVDFTPHPPTFTPSPTIDATATPATEVAPLAFDVSVSGDIGSVQTFSAGFPWQGNSKSAHLLRITVTDIPHSSGNDGRRIVDYTLTCNGSGSGVLMWDWALAQSTPHTCGETLRSNGLLWSSNFVQFLISAPLTGSDSVTYTVTIKVSAYPG